MIGHGGIARLRGARRGSRFDRCPRTPRELATTLGRAALWLTVGVVLLRGLETLSREQQTLAPRAARGVPMAAWPDDAARAFAVEFTAAYFTHSRSDAPGANATALEAFASPELVAQLVPQFAAGAPSEVVQSAVVTGAVRLDDRHALVSVAATVAGPGNRRRVVTVPIARDGRGGLVVDDLPSFGSVPARALINAPDVEPVLGSERSAVIGVLTPFLRAYLAGDTAGLAYLVPPGTRIEAAAGRWELIDLTSVGAIRPRSGGSLVVLVAVAARDTQTRASYALRYRVRLVRRDRWYVADLNGPGRAKR